MLIGYFINMVRQKATHGALEVQSLVFETGGLKILDKVCFALQPGEALVVKGCNGSGKTTLLKILAGLLLPTEGQFSYQGVTAANPRDLWDSLFHYAGHQISLKSVLTLADNLKFYAALYGVKSAPDRALAETGLEHLENIPVRMLSEGQKRRAALARLLMVRLPIWFLDEPLLGLDALGLTLFAKIARAHLEAGGRLVAASHSDLGIPVADSITLGEKL